MECFLGLKKQAAQLSYQRITEDLKVTTTERLKEVKKCFSSAVALVLEIRMCLLWCQ